MTSSPRRPRPRGRKPTAQPRPPRPLRARRRHQSPPRSPPPVFLARAGRRDPRPPREAALRVGVPDLGEVDDLHLARVDWRDVGIRGVCGVRDMADAVLGVTDRVAVRRCRSSARAARRRPPWRALREGRSRGGPDRGRVERSAHVSHRCQRDSAHSRPSARGRRPAAPSSRPACEAARCAWPARQVLAPSASCE